MKVIQKKKRTIPGQNLVINQPIIYFKKSLPYLPASPWRFSLNPARRLVIQEDQLLLAGLAYQRHRAIRE
jgi:hypothetical protein